MKNLPIFDSGCDLEDFCYKGALLIKTPYGISEVFYYFGYEVEVTFYNGAKKIRNYYVYLDEMEVEQISSDKFECFFLISLALEDVNNVPDMLSVGKSIDIRFTWDSKTFAIVSWPMIKIYLDGNESGKIITISPFTVRSEKPLAIKGEMLDIIDWKIYKLVHAMAKEYAIKRKLFILDIDEIMNKLQLARNVVFECLEKLKEAECIHFLPGPAMNTKCIFEYRVSDK